MTLIAFATYDNRAEIITDTAAYTPLCRTFGYRKKFMTLPHLDAVVATQGGHAFGTVAKVELGELDRSFDETVARTPDLLRSVWAETAGRPGGDPSAEGSVFLIGYSTTAGAFVGYRFLAEHSFECEAVAGVHVMPTPLDYAPQPFELARLRSDADARYSDLFGEWANQPAPEVPSSREEWVDLALLARRRSLMPMPDLRVIVGGKLLWTRVARGRTRTEVIHEFNDQGTELDMMVAGTLHPRAQVAPCECESGKPALDCCLAEIADEPCPCSRDLGGGVKTFRDCCQVTPAEATRAATMGLVVDD